MPDIDDFVQPPLAATDGSKEVGKVYLVGAGPGDPGLITVRGLECLKMADFVLYDGLTNAGLLDFAERAECFSVGKHGAEPIWSQPEINLKMVELARRGKTVVRLKGGIPPFRANR